MLVPPDNRLSQSGTKLTQQALREAGVPVLAIDADMVDDKNWSHVQMVSLFEEFLKGHGLV
jgi:benzoyl-CoA reductase subunit B